jgi:simple sugar transport system permease protein
MDLILNILYDTFYHSTPVILLSIGGVFAYKANVLNIALEGMLLFGAFVSAYTIYQTGSVLLALMLALILTILLGMLFSYFGITKKGHVIIIGIAINMLVVAIGSFILKVEQIATINISQIVSVADQKINLWLIKDIPLLQDVISGHPLMTYVSFILIFVLTTLMFKTKFGTYVRVVGENEEAAKSIGINVEKIKYLAISVGAVTSAIAGFNLAVERLALYTNSMSAGRGFIAIAAIYSGRGRPGLSSVYAIIFGLAQALAINLKLYAGPVSGLFEAIPYLVMVVVLVVVSIGNIKKETERGYPNV